MQVDGLTKSFGDLVLVFFVVVGYLHQGGALAAVHCAVAEIQFCHLKNSPYRKNLQVAIAQCEENESHFKYGFSAGLLVQQEAHAQVSQKNKE